MATDEIDILGIAAMQGVAQRLMARANSKLYTASDGERVDLRFEGGEICFGLRAHVGNEQCRGAR
jgi:hypothetical protein